MVKPVEPYDRDFIEAGALLLTFHPEASEHIDRVFADESREGGCKRGWF